jgi:hypothetical protein
MWGCGGGWTSRRRAESSRRKLDAVGGELRRHQHNPRGHARAASAHGGARRISTASHSRRLSAQLAGRDVEALGATQQLVARHALERKLETDGACQVRCPALRPALPGTARLRRRGARMGKFGRRRRRRARDVDSCCALRTSRGLEVRGRFSCRSGVRPSRASARGDRRVHARRLALFTAALSRRIASRRGAGTRGLPPCLV